MKTKEILVLDRIEGDKAIFETESGEARPLPKSLLPNNFREGDVFCLQSGVLVFDVNATHSRRERIESKLSKLFHRT